MKPFAFHPEDEAEFEEAIRTYEKQRAGRGIKFRDAVESAVRAILHNPNMHSRYKESEFRKCVVQHFPYVLFYMELEEVIWFAAVAHAKRRPGYWMSRTPQD
jgi:toxin ParE1/3/4